MGKTDGFLLYKRELPTKDAVADRVQHYKEFQHFCSEISSQNKIEIAVL